MKILIILILVCIIVLQINSVDAAKKPYNCYDHYTDAYCNKTLGKTTKPKIILTDININNTTRETIDIIKITQKDLEYDLAKYRDELQVSNNAIMTLEKKTSELEYQVKQAKLVHKVTPNEASRLQLEKATELLTAKQTELAKEKENRKTIQNNINNITQKILEIKDKVIQSDKIIHQNKKKFDTKIKTIGITISNSCVTMLKNDMKTTCPTFATIMALNLDTSKKESGSFSFYDGYYHRGDPLLKNDYKMYDFEKYNVIVDPSPAMMQRVKMIIISPSLSNYLLSDDLTKVNNTRIIHKDRYVDNCKEATISSKTWLDTIGDTVNYLRSGCTGTLLNTIDTFTDNSTITKIEQSSKWKHDQWLKGIKESHKQLMINKDNSTNKSVIEDEDK